MPYWNQFLMLLQKEATDSKVNIRSYKAGEIHLNIGQFTDVVFLADGEKKEFLGAEEFDDLTFEQLRKHLDIIPEILIIGSGEKQRFLPLDIVKKINDLSIAVETMASRQACHTYQVLSYEKRVVFALIYP